jgi:hypothetical protein
VLNFDVATNIVPPLLLDRHRLAAQSGKAATLRGLPTVWFREAITARTQYHVVLCLTICVLHIGH